MPDLTRDRVRRALDGVVAAGWRHVDEGYREAATDAVMALVGEAASPWATTERDEAEARELALFQRAEAAERRLAEMAEAPQPRVLLRGHLVGFDSGDGLEELLLTVRGEWLPEDRRVSLGRTSGTRVVVTEEEACTCGGWRERGAVCDDCPVHGVIEEVHGDAR